MKKLFALVWATIIATLMALVIGVSAAQAYGSCTYQQFGQYMWGTYAGYPAYFQCFPTNAYYGAWLPVYVCWTCGGGGPGPRPMGTEETS